MKNIINSLQSGLLSVLEQFVSQVFETFTGISLEEENACMLSAMQCCCNDGCC